MSNPPRRLAQTGLLTGRRQPPPNPTPVSGVQFSERADDIPRYFLLQIGAPDGSITTLGLQVRPRLVFGRADPNNEFMPDLDLTPYGAKDAGVSRQHAHVYQEKDNLVVQDNYSRNGTFLNNERLDEGEVRQLKDGDYLILGRLPLSIYFVYNDSTR